MLVAGQAIVLWRANHQTCAIATERHRVAKPVAIAQADVDIPRADITVTDRAHFLATAKAGVTKVE